MEFLKNFKEKWPLTNEEKKDVKKFDDDILKLQGDLKEIIISGNKSLTRQVMWEIKNLADHKNELMQKVWSRRRKALIGK
jgi:hypothetical protein